MSRNLMNEFDKQPFNEDYINAFEDIDLSYRIMQKNCKISIINYNIRPLTGFILGTESIRDARTIAGRYYFFSNLQRQL